MLDTVEIQEINVQFLNYIFTQFELYCIGGHSNYFASIAFFFFLVAIPADSGDVIHQSCK